jgi:hypothetical protein
MRQEIRRGAASRRAFIEVNHPHTAEETKDSGGWISVAATHLRRLRLVVAGFALAGAIQCGGDPVAENGKGDSGRPQATDGAVTEVSDGVADGDHTCDGGAFGEASDGTRTPVFGAATVELDVSAQNEILELETTLRVPRRPSPMGTFFVWPGLQPLPGGRAYQPVGNGVLQTVLTWGATCAPGAPEDPYAGWWISAEYVNVNSAVDALAGCSGGDGVLVDEDDTLHIVMKRDGTGFAEHVVNERSGAASDHDVDLREQAQGRALFAIERRDTNAALGAVFTATRITFASPEPAACQPAARGAGDSFSVPYASRDGTTCCIDRITLATDTP